MKTIGYISGTFDLFHIGHLNIIKKAKENCDYLIVGVHESGAWKGKDTFIPFKERLEIISAIKYVDQVVKSYPNDTDAINHHNIKKLFVGDDYKGSDRFKKYEKFVLKLMLRLFIFHTQNLLAAPCLEMFFKNFNIIKK